MHGYMLGTLLMAKLRWEVDMQIDKVDDQLCRHLHRSGAPQKDGKAIFHLERRVKGPGAPLAEASNRKTCCILGHQGF
uniref:Uncharacterized protein n=1 Tax=Romanomermis culicivorax TaxID=13658 RepID=A0A915HM32_ROMCU